VVNDSEESHELRLSGENQGPRRFAQKPQKDPSRAINTVIEELEHQSEESVKEDTSQSYYAPENMFVDFDALERRALQRN